MAAAVAAAVVPAVAAVVVAAAAVAVAAVEVAVEAAAVAVAAVGSQQELAAVAEWQLALGKPACLVGPAFPAFQALPVGGRPAAAAHFADWLPCWVLFSSETSRVVPCHQDQSLPYQQSQKPVTQALKVLRHLLSSEMIWTVTHSCLTEPDCLLGVLRQLTMQLKKLDLE